MQLLDGASFYQGTNQDPIESTITSSKTRAGSNNFYFVASLVLRLARRMCRTQLNSKRQAREPFKRLAMLNTLHKDSYPTIAKLNHDQLIDIGNKLKEFINLKHLKTGLIVNQLAERLLSSNAMINSTTKLNSLAKPNNFFASERLVID